jgi:8-oxo-dGTP pyrophosphatase MutT (NUDIX family)
MDVRSDMVVIYVLRPDGRRGFEALQMKRAPGRYLAGKWAFCSGGIEPGETATRAARRELLEETGIQADALHPLPGVETFFLPQADAVVHRVGFVVRVAREARIRLNEEHTDLRWIGRGEFREKVMWPGERAALAQIRRDHLGTIEPDDSGS